MQPFHADALPGSPKGFPFFLKFAEIISLMKQIGFLFLLILLAFGCKKDKDQGKETGSSRIETGEAIGEFQLAYPETRREDTTDTYFGTTVPDPYRWLEDDHSMETIDWVQAQNELTFEYLSLLPKRQEIRSRMTELWNYPKESAPRKRGKYFFYFRNDGLQNQSLLYRIEGLESEPSVFIDPNKFSQDGTTALSGAFFSQDNKYVAYGKSVSGSDWQEFRVKEVDTGKELDDKLEHIKFSGAAWQGEGFYYARYPEANEGEELSSVNTNKQLFYHQLGTYQSQDKLIYEDPANPMNNFYPYTTDDGKYLILTKTRGATDNNALSFMDLEKKDPLMQPLIEDYDNDYNVIDTYGDKLLVLTDKDAPKKRVVLINPRRPKEKKWKEVIPEREEVLESVDFVGGKLIAVYMKDATHQVHVWSPDGEYLYELSLPGIGTVSGFGGKKDENLTFYTFNSFVSPSVIYKYDTETNTSSVYRESEIQFDFSKYVTEEIFCKSKDGTRVPIFVTHRKDIEFDGSNPTFLYGYGGFNANILPGFSVSPLVFLENGGVYAEAVLRGGGEYGEEWHQAGILLKKQNVFDDFIAAAEYLIKQGYTSPGKLAIHGRSNGGLLVGACMTQRPDLFKVALPGVGVMDMLRFHKFTIGHAWVVEYGSSERSQAEFANLYAYSPLHNIKPNVAYPATLVTTADHDDRVVPAHSFKFISELQHQQTGDKPVLIRIETKAGHGSGKSTTKRIEEWADIWAFVFYHLGMTGERNTPKL
jgi:prolyl oligopeptidase